MIMLMIAILLYALILTLSNAALNSSCNNPGVLNPLRYDSTDDPTLLTRYRFCLRSRPPAVPKWNPVFLPRRGPVCGCFMTHADESIRSGANAYWVQDATSLDVDALFSKCQVSVNGQVAVMSS